MLAVISIGIANMLVLLRVVILWDEHPVSLEASVQTSLHLTCLLGSVKADGGRLHHEFCHSGSNYYHHAH